MSGTAVAVSILLISALILTPMVAFWTRQTVDDPVLLRFVSVTALGAVALFCIFGLLYLSTPPTPQPLPESQAQYRGEQTQTEAGTAAVTAASAATSASTLGVTGQIISILGTIGAAAVGGIAGLLVSQPRRDGSPVIGDEGGDG